MPFSKWKFRKTDILPVAATVTPPHRSIPPEPRPSSNISPFNTSHFFTVALAEMNTHQLGGTATLGVLADNIRQVA